MPDHRRIRSQSAGDEHSGLGQPVTRIERLGLEARRRERRGEPLHRKRAHRLGADGRNTPVTEVEGRAFLRRAPLDAQVVGEIRPAARIRAVLADRLHPVEWVLQECRRRQEDQGRSAIHRLQDSADEAQVVVRRQPVDADADVPVVLERRQDHALVVHHVAMRHHHSLRVGGGAGGVLQERERIPVVGDQPPGAPTGRIELVRHDERQAGQGGECSAGW